MKIIIRRSLRIKYYTHISNFLYILTFRKMQFIVKNSEYEGFLEKA